MAKDNFEEWGIIELFGHQQIAGLVSEATIGGCSFVRVDVPEVEDRPAFTRFYGEKAIYSLTPVSEAVARAATQQFRARPVTVYMPELLPGPTPAQTFGQLVGETGHEQRRREDDDELPF